MWMIPLFGFHRFGICFSCERFDHFSVCKGLKQAITVAQGSQVNWVISSKSLKCCNREGTSVDLNNPPFLRRIVRVQFVHSEESMLPCFQLDLDHVIVGQVGRKLRVLACRIAVTELIPRHIQCCKKFLRFHFSQCAVHEMFWLNTVQTKTSA